MNLNRWTSVKKQDLFKMTMMPVRPLELNNRWHSRVTVEMSLDRTDSQRTRYTVLDLLAAFGGFMGIFRWVFGHFMAAWNYQALDNYMVSQLYRAGASALEREHVRAVWATTHGPTHLLIRT